MKSFFAGLVICSALLAPLVSSSVASAANKAPGSGTLIIETAEARHSFTVELASTPASRARGLMYRRTLNEGTGMLFDFVKNQHVTMWMKNTYVSLDMLFINSEGRIINIARNTIPHSLKHISSDGPVQAVLEIAGGHAEKLKIKAGDFIRHNIFRESE
ncbi:MAG: DUF192 domain-containing protein [Alphaproteobacteria bacterium]|nr:DUF192 domain-containing protein [Alphaproteobacteria bacterium]MBT4084290.1 DUF192 domain-containing protein [Alphaproteobacteria bacterium]MBT4545831.1 DUF192 domain-containing protein [Alphaproteobacteria bacterium]MBT6386721.1 DUF192 domain-containing protein [Alphaproteobacteria bacterium]MBT7746900.1 DUF192 domain-containing protein [Alphaproteobacteria bacterium]